MNDLHTIGDIEIVHQEAGMVHARVLFRPEHEIFQGHFPDNPIVPGVIQLYYVKHILEKIIEGELFLSQIRSIKFLKLISPATGQHVIYEISFSRPEENHLKVKAVINDGSHTFMKFSGQYTLSL